MLLISCFFSQIIQVRPPAPSFRGREFQLEMQSRGSRYGWVGSSDSTPIFPLVPGQVEELLSGPFLHPRLVCCSRRCPSGVQGPVCGVEKVSPPRHDWVEGPRIEVTNGELWSASTAVIHWVIHHSICELWNGGDLTWSSSPQELPNVLGAWKFLALRYFLCSWVEAGPLWGPL